MNLGLIRKMSADLKPLLIDLEGDQKPTGRKRKQRERLSEEDIMYLMYAIVQRTVRTLIDTYSVRFRNYSPSLSIL
jgi:hypothetical protein